MNKRPVKRSKRVEMRQRRRDYFPHVFAWEGQEYRVEAVEQCWTIPRHGRENRVAGYCFRVRACPDSGEADQEGVFDLFEDAQTGDWRMRRQIQ